MYAIIETGSKQYRVQLGQVIQIEKLAGPEGSESPIHSEVEFNQVLLLKPEGDTLFLGKPFFRGSSSRSRSGWTRPWRKDPHCQNETQEAVPSYSGTSSVLHPSPNNCD